MMAFDRAGPSGGDRFPTAETLAAMERSLTDFLSGAGDEGGVCKALERLATEADARQLKAEHMLLAFKAIWAALPEVQAIRDSAERRRITEHLVKLCIDAYYSR
jgi:hypothetical protein